MDFQNLSLTGPALDAARFGFACLLGVGLGLLYGFLRPLRPKHTLLSDLLLIPGVFWAWLYLGFAVCRGDIRLSYTAGLLLGAVVWEVTFGKWLRPVFFGFWHLLGKFWQGFWGIFRKIFEKIRKIAKILFAFRKKWFTIKVYRQKFPRKKKGGVPHGKQEKRFQPFPDRDPPQPSGS